MSFFIGGNFLFTELLESEWLKVNVFFLCDVFLDNLFDLIVVYFADSLSCAIIFARVFVSARVESDNIWVGRVNGFLMEVVFGSTVLRAEFALVVAGRLAAVMISVFLELVEFAGLGAL